MPISSDDLQLTAPAPDPVMGTSAQIVGPTGQSVYHYWWVAHYPIGVTIVSAPVIVRSAPDSLTITNYVIVAGQPALGATSYDLLRTPSNRFPTVGPATIAVAIGLTTPTFNDQGAALTSYNIAGLAGGAPVTNHMILNNRDFAQPTVVVSPYRLSVSALVFPDGSTQSSAGAPLSQLYSWQQDVQANNHNLLSLNTWKLVSSDNALSMTAGVNSSTTTPVNSDFWMQNGAGTYNLIINQNGDVWIGPQSNILGGGRAGRLVVSMPAGYPNPANFLGYFFSTLGSSTVRIESAFAGGTAGLQLMAATNNVYSLTAFSTNIVLATTNMSPGNLLIITPSGNIGIPSAGANFGPTHNLELAADSAAKPATNTWTITSDIRTKRNVRPLEGGLTVIEQLEPIEAEYNGMAHTPHGSRVVSFDPEHLAPIIPGAVSKVRRKLNPDDEADADVQCVNTHEVLFHLVLAVQQLSKEMKKTKRKVN